MAKTEDRSQLRITRRVLLKSGIVLVSAAALTHNRIPFRGAAARAATPAKRIYIAPDDHTDYFWTAGEEEYRQAFLRMLDYYLDLADQTDGNAPEYQSRWNCDGSFWMWTFEQNRSQAEFERLIARIRSGHISVPLNALCICIGGAPAEAVLRGMYYSGKIERKYDVRFRLAYLMENQTLSYGVVSLFAGSGAKYSWKGICNCDTRLADAGNREHEIYWWAGPDDSRLLMKWNSWLMGSQSIGGYAEARRPAEVVDFVDQSPEFKSRYPYQVIGAFGKGWDDLETMTDEFVTTAINKTNSNRQVIVSNEEDFFDDFVATYGDAIPVTAASFGNEWDLYCAALAEVSARVKRAVEKLRSAEALATLATLKDSAFMDGKVALRDQAWLDLGLFWEHNFGMVGAPSGLVDERIAWQRRLASEIEEYVDGLAASATARLGQLIAKTGANARFFVFNCLSWVRTDVVDWPYSGATPVHVVDVATGQEVPSQVVSVAGKALLRILAPDVPAVGYKVFEVRPGAGAMFEDAATVTGNTIENDEYRLVLANHGAITSLIDKRQGNREFAGNLDGFALNDLGGSGSSLQLENAGPVSVTLKATAFSPLSRTTRVTLLRHSRRIEIQNEIQQNFTTTQAWKFSFNLAQPDVWHEEVGAVMRARLTTQGGHYAPRNARYDWLTLNHFADMTGANVGVTLSNADCYFMQLGNSTETTLDTATPQIKVLAGGRLGGYGGLPDQGGDNRFLQRFALRTHGAYDVLTAMKFALEHQNPLLAGVVSGGSEYPEGTFSLLAVDNANVLVWALKPADDGIANGVIARVWNLSASALDFKMTFFQHGVESAGQVTHIETPVGPAAVSGNALLGELAAQQMKSYAVKMSIAAGPTPTDTLVPPPTGTTEPPTSTGTSEPPTSTGTSEPPTSTGTPQPTRFDVSLMLPLVIK